MTSHSFPRSRLGLFASLGFVLLTLVVGCGGGSSSTPPPVERVAQQIARTGAASVIVFVSDDGREYVATAGTRRPNADKRFRRCEAKGIPQVVLTAAADEPGNAHWAVRDLQKRGGHVPSVVVGSDTAGKPERRSGVQQLT
jgi:hypothetical protein